MKLLLSALLGYLIGSLNPSALISKLKKDDLRTHGTGNLGATNVNMVYGRMYGALVMIFDISKSVIAYKIAEHLLFKDDATYAVLAGMLASGMAVAGHIFPFYMRFRGGKGVAAFAGMVIAYQPIFLLILVPICFSLMLIFNYGFMLPISGVVLFCIMATFCEKSVWIFIITAFVAVLIIMKHIPNIKKVATPDEIRARDYVKYHILKHSGVSKNNNAANADVDTDPTNKN